MDAFKEGIKDEAFLRLMSTFIILRLKRKIKEATCSLSIWERALLSFKEFFVCTLMVYTISKALYAAF